MECSVESPPGSKSGARFPAKSRISNRVLTLVSLTRRRDRSTPGLSIEMAYARSRSPGYASPVPLPPNLEGRAL
jgi:hypothetical protein